MLLSWIHLFLLFAHTDHCLSLFWWLSSGAAELWQQSCICRNKTGRVCQESKYFLKCTISLFWHFIEFLVFFFYEHFNMPVKKCTANHLLLCFFFFFFATCVQEILQDSHFLRHFVFNFQLVFATVVNIVAWSNYQACLYKISPSYVACNIKCIAASVLTLQPLPELPVSTGWILSVLIHTVHTFQTVDSKARSLHVCKILQILTLTSIADTCFIFNLIPWQQFTIST